MSRSSRQRDAAKLSELTPQSALGLQRLDRWWRLEFLRAVLDRIDVIRLDDGLEAYQVGTAIPGFAERIPHDRPGGYANWREKRAWIIYSYAVLGSAARAAGLPLQTKAAFVQAEAELEDFADAPLWLRGQLALRKACYLFLECALEGEGLALLDRAQQYALEDEEEPVLGSQGLADTRSMRGIFLALQGNPQAVVEMAAAARLSDRTTTRGRATYDGALTNLIVATTDLEVPLEQQAAALTALRKTQQQMSPHLRLRRLRLMWCEARLRANLGLADEARTLMDKVYHHLIKQRASSFDLVMACLDFARMHLSTPRRAQQAARETLELLSQRGADEPLLAAVRSFVECELSNEQVQALQSRTIGHSLGRIAA